MKQLCTFPRIITGYPGFSVLAYCYRMLYCFADLVLRMQETHCTTVSTCFRDYFERFSLNMSDRLWALSMVQGHAEFSCGAVLEVKCVISALAALNEIAKIMFPNRLPKTSYHPFQPTFNLHHVSCHTKFMLTRILWLYSSIETVSRLL